MWTPHILLANKKKKHPLTQTTLWLCVITNVHRAMLFSTRLMQLSCNTMGQKNMITAQGKFDPNQNTGISIQNCTIWPYRDLSDVQTFLGRPWKNYSTTVYVNNMMGCFIDPMGWMPWVGTSAPDTIFYAEFGNYGPGALTKNRVVLQVLCISRIE